MNNVWRNIQFVTGNADKAREVSQILGINISQISPGELIEIQNTDVSVIVEHKASQAYQLVKKPVLVEDSGLFIKAWNGLPGALIKWFERSVGCAGIVKMLNQFENRNASALCYAAVNDGNHIRIAKGEVSGRIAFQVCGKNGFGWDSIFIPDGHERTFGEMSIDEKNTISHRKRAIESLKEII